MFTEKKHRNTKIFLEKLGYEAEWIDESMTTKELEQKVKKLLKRKPKLDSRSYKELSFPESAGGYGLSTTYLQTVVNRERNRYGI